MLLFREAFWGVAARPWRSLSLVIALGVAVGCVTFSASVLGGFAKEMERLAFGDYSRALVIRANPFVPSRRGPPTLGDRTILLDTLDGVESSAAWVEGVTSIRVGNDTRVIPVYGALGEYRTELDANLSIGRWFSDQELGGLARVCLVGPDLAEDLGQRAALLDSFIHLEGTQCRVIGVLERGRSRPSARFRSSIIAPFATARRYLANPATDTEPSLRDADWLTFFMAEKKNMEDARYEADRIMRKLAGVPLSRESPFIFDDPAALVREQEAQRSLLTRLLFTITGAALASSIIGYGGVAFASTVSRKREIALRLAIGATRDAIWMQFLIEHLLLGGFASLVGLAVGILGAAAAGMAWGWPIYLSWPGALLSIGIGVSVGVSLGFVAARLASNTEPARAAKG